MPTSPMAQPEATPENRDTSEDESNGATFGPWVVVSRKRKDSKLEYKSRNNHVAVLRSASGHENSKETLGSRSLNNEDGLSRISKDEGKRKAQCELGLNMVSKEQVNVKETLSTSLGPDGLRNQGRFSHGSAKGKPHSNLVKGKKEFARSRALHFNSPQFGRTKEVNNSSTECTLSISSIQADQNGGFKFGAYVGRETSEQHGWRVFGEPESDYGGVGSSSHSHNDSVQAEFPMGMEDHKTSLEKNGKHKVDHEKDEGVQHLTNNPGEMGGCAVASCVIKAGQRPDNEDGMVDRLDFDGGSGFGPSI